MDVIDEDFIERLLGISPAKYTEMRIEHSNGEELLMVNGELKESSILETSGFSIRTIDKGIGFYFSNKMTKTEMRKGLTRAVRMAKLQRKHKMLSDEKSHVANDYVQGSFPDIDEKLEFIKSLDKHVANHQRMFAIGNEITDHLYVNSDGSKIKATTPRVSLMYMLTVAEENGVEQMHREFGNVGGWEQTKRWKVVNQLDHDATFLTKLLKKGEKPPSRGDVIIGPFITGLIAHESCGHPFEADRILGREAAQAGKSYATEDLIGKKIAHECINIADDPTIPHSNGYYKYDSEGIKARRRMLIKNGVVTEFLHNRSTAHIMGCTSNAAARCTYGKEPIVRMANTFFMPGNHNHDELLEDIKEGVFIVTFMEWNIDDRRENQKYVGQEAYHIKNGELSNIVVHPRIEISTLEFYKKVDAAGKNLFFYPATCGKGDPMQGIPVSTGGVDLRLRDVRIT